MSHRRRSSFYDRAARLTSYVATSAGDATFLVQTQDQNVGKSLFVKQSRSEMAYLARAVALVTATLGAEAIEGRQFFDVGANIGTTTVTALLDHPFDKAVAFEPEPQNLLTLRLNLLLNGVEERGTVHEAVVSNRVGTAELVVTPDRGGKHWVPTDSAQLDQVDGNSTVIEVRRVTLDQLADEGTIEPDRVGLLWMDAQAHEGHILQGATCLTDRSVPIVLEWSPAELDLRGDRSALQTILKERYTHFIDLRASHDRTGPEPAFALTPTGELEEYTERVMTLGSRKHTDLLVLRLEEDLPADFDILKLLRGQGAHKLGGLVRRSRARKRAGGPKRASGPKGGSGPKADGPKRASGPKGKGKRRNRRPRNSQD